MSSQEYQFIDKVRLVQDSFKLAIENFSNKPGNYFYEEDLRSELFYILREKFNDLPIELIKDSWFERYTGQKVNPVRGEYGNDSDYFSFYKVSNIDIAILSNKSVEGKERNNYLRYCDIIIELKYSTEKFDSKHAGFWEDIKKIKNAINFENHLGVAICFDLHNPNDEKEKAKFLRDYKEKNINFEQIEIDKLKLSSNASYAIYVTTTEVYISVEKE